MIRYLCLFLFLFATGVTVAQVTTATVTGTIKTVNGDFLSEANIVVTCMPTGSVYKTALRADGGYAIPGLKTGGPYNIAFSFTGYDPVNINNVNIDLNIPLKIDIILNKASKRLYNVIVNGSPKYVAQFTTNGYSTTVTLNDSNNLPIQNTSFADFTRFIPEANPVRGTVNNGLLGMSYLGQNPKYNLFTVDGAKAANVFGIYSNSGNINPIPVQSMLSLQALLSPYDVIYGRFLGGDVSLITKSGTNKLHGEGYAYYQNQALIGKSTVTGLNYPDFVNKALGVNLGGPIIKNKLFFFADLENSQFSAPLIYDPTQANSGSKFDPAVLQGIQNYVQKKYGFDLGSFAGINRKINSTSALGRLDFDIDNKNKLTFRNSYVSGQNFVIGRAPTSLTFSNGGYNVNINTNSTVLELNSMFSNHASNVFRTAYNYVNNVRNSSAFPSVNISEGSLVYNFGGDYSSAANSSAQKDFNVTDYLNIYHGKHTITIGTDNDFYALRSVFLPNYYGYYTYKSVAAFEANATPADYSVSYSTAGGADKAPDAMKAIDLSVYGQDVWELTNRFRLTYGIRVETPVFTNSPNDNHAFNSSAIALSNGVATNRKPKSNLLFSPRVGLNYDVFGDQTTQLKGGAGIFTGDVPYIWIGNQYANTGVGSISFTGIPQGLTFNYSPANPHLGAYIPPNLATARTEIDVTDPNFKMPQQFHTNLSVSQKLPMEILGTFGGSFSKTITDILYKNLNLGSPETTLALGNTTRPYYNFTYLDNNYTDVIELTNTNKGYSYQFTGRLVKQFLSGWLAMAAYTFGHSYSANDGFGPTSIGNWRTAYTANDLNSPDEAYANFDLGSRLIAYVSKTFARPNRHFVTTISIIYSGQSGQQYSYLYNYNINGDGISNKFIPSDLVYIPTDASQFASFSRQVNGVTTVVTPQQQLVDLQAYMADNQDLQKYAGKNTTRNGFSLPWENHIDLRVAESINMTKNRQLLFSVYLINAADLFLKSWGRVYTLVNQEYNLFNVVNTSADPKFTFDNSKLNSVNGHLRAYSIDDYNSRWKAQLNLSYNF